MLTGIPLKYAWLLKLGTQIRLLDGSNPSEGRLEVKHDNEWGTVCGTNFDASDGRVVCRMFGYDTE